MTETKQPYTVPAQRHADTPVSANISVFMDTDDILGQYFKLTLTGLVITGDPPQDAFDLQLARLHTDLDRVRWALGDLCVAYSRKFGGNVYAKAAAMCGFWRSMSTIEKWASIARQVLLEVRIPAEVDGQPTGMSIYWHAHVTGLPTEVQRQLLQGCLQNNYTEAKFDALCREYKYGRNDAPEPEPRPTAARDVIFQMTTELGLAESRLEAAAVETSQLAQTVTATDARLQQIALAVARLAVGV